MTQFYTDNKTPAMARGMIILAWLVGLAFATYLIQQYLNDRNNPNQNLGMTAEGKLHEVKLLRNRQGHYVADGEINGHKVTFLIDTGATDVAIPAGLAEVLNLPKGRVGISQTANGEVRTWRTSLEQVRLGSIRINNVRASILPSMRKNDEILLGMSFLRQLELAQKEGVLTLRQDR